MNQDPMTIIKNIGYAVLALITLAAFLTWWSLYPDYQACLANSSSNKGECVIGFMMQSPPAQDLLEINESCSNSSATGKCITTLGQRVAEDKLTEDNKNG